MCCNVEKTPEMDAYMEKVAAIFKECQDENKSGTLLENYLFDFLCKKYNSPQMKREAKNSER